MDLGRAIISGREQIENRKAGRPARIVAKMNQLEDPDVIRALVEAAGAGVPIDLIVRGFCCLKPGVAGQTEGIRVRSIIGRFLEHARIFHFAAGAEDPAAGEFFIVSRTGCHGISPAGSQSSRRSGIRRLTRDYGNC